MDYLIAAIIGAAIFYTYKAYVTGLQAVATRERNKNKPIEDMEKELKLIDDEGRDLELEGFRLKRITREKKKQGK